MSIQEKTGKFAYVPSHIAWFRTRNQWFSRGAKTPRKGDVIFFGDEAHVGLVEYVVGSTVHTIEGNTKNSAGVGGVLRHSYSLTSTYIMGYGRPAYAAGEADAIVAIAQSQVGYLEKKSNYDLDSFTANAGNGNWTKYGQWYGINPGDWGDMFVSWCAWAADQEEIPSGGGDSGTKEEVRYSPWVKWKNGSTDEPVYKDTDRTVKTGSMNPYEEAECVGRYGDSYLISYKLDDTADDWAVGYVEYNGGIVE